MGDPVYTVHISPDVDDVLTCLVNKAVPAGIDGPCSPSMPCEGMTLTQIDAELLKHGYRRVSDYATVKAYDGLRLKAEVMPL